MQRSHAHTCRQCLQDPPFDLTGRGQVALVMEWGRVLVSDLFGLSSHTWQWSQVNVCLGMEWSETHCCWGRCLLFLCPMLICQRLTPGTPHPNINCKTLLITALNLLNITIFFYIVRDTSVGVASSRLCSLSVGWIIDQLQNT